MVPGLSPPGSGFASYTKVQGRLLRKTRIYGLSRIARFEILWALAFPHEDFPRVHHDFHTLGGQQSGRWLLRSSLLKLPESRPPATLLESTSEGGPRSVPAGFGWVPLGCVVGLGYGITGVMITKRK